MSRSGYDCCDDLDDLELGRWRGMVASATRGKRGQEFFRKLVAALDAMPEKRLIKEELITEEGDVCALGAVLRNDPRLAKVGPEDHDIIGNMANIAPCLVQEVEYENDEGRWKESDEQRWERMREWAESQIVREVNG